jgi:GTP-binding protein
VDTAGIRSQGKTEGLEGLMVLKTFQALKKAHLAILVLDIAEGITAQDCRVAGMAHDRGRGLIIFANKFDLLQKSKEENPENLRRQIREEIYDKMPFVRYAPIIIGSALKGRFSKSQFFNKLNAVEKYRHLEVKTAELNRYLQEVLKKRPLPTRGGKRLKIYYMTQSLPQNEKRGIQPTTPSFLCFVNFPKKVHYSDERFLVNCLRKRYEFMGNPIFLEFRSSQRLKIDKSL